MTSSSCVPLPTCRSRIESTAGPGCTARGSVTSTWALRSGTDGADLSEGPAATPLGENQLGVPHRHNGFGGVRDRRPAASLHIGVVLAVERQVAADDPQRLLPGDVVEDSFARPFAHPPRQHRRTALLEVQQRPSAARTSRREGNQAERNRGQSQNAHRCHGAPPPSPPAPHLPACRLRLPVHSLVTRSLAASRTAAGGRRLKQDGNLAPSATWGPGTGGLLTGSVRPLVDRDLRPIAPVREHSRRALPLRHSFPRRKRTFSVRVSSFFSEAGTAWT